MKAITAISFAAVTMLSACGGGGDESSTYVRPDEGYWTGTSSNGWEIDAVILENGETWGLYSIGSTIYGAFKGQSSSEGNTFRATGKQFDLQTNQGFSGSLSGTVIPQASITAQSSITPITLNLQYNAAYDQPATLSKVQGSYSMKLRTVSYDGITAVVNIGADGRFSLVDGGCTTSGSLTPRPSGKNVYNVQVVSSGTCLLGNTTFNGVGVYMENAATPYIITLALNGSETDGFIGIGTKINN